MLNLKKKSMKLICAAISFIVLFSIPVFACSTGEVSDNIFSETDNEISIMALDCPRRLFCPHAEFYHLERETGHYRYSPISATQHAVFNNKRHVCQICNQGVEVWDREDSLISNHTYSGYQDLGHSASGIHRYQRSCTVCGYVQDVTLGCSGPPCVAPYSLLM